MNIEQELKKGHFVVGKCNQCRKNVWPPMEYCNRCFGDVSIKDGPSRGKIIEFSMKGKECFCLVELNKEIRVMGKLLSGIPENRQNVQMKKCGMKGKNYFFEFSLI